jgi:fructose-bisphosphate aldolase, class II
MPLVNGIDMLKAARRQGYAVGGFDIFDFESVRAVVAAAEAERSPVFLQACVNSAEYLGFEQAGLMMRDAAERATVPVAVHYDHGPRMTCLTEIAQALRAGFTSVMIDESRLPLDENIELTRQAVHMAHEDGAGAEGEIGQIGRITGGRADEVAVRMAQTDTTQDWLTSVQEAVRFVNETGVDYVAVSIGSVSGSSSRLNVPLMRELAGVIAIPLVLHGGSGVPAEDLQEAIAFGLAKVNIAHGVRRAFIKAMRDALADGKNTDNPYALLASGRQAMQDYVATKIRQLRPAGN